MNNQKKSSQEQSSIIIKILTGFKNALLKLVSVWKGIIKIDDQVLNRKALWCTVIMLPLTIVGLVIAYNSMHQNQQQKEGSGKNTEVDVTQSTKLHIPRVVLDEKQSYFEPLGDQETATTNNKPVDFINVGAPIDDTWVPSRKWYIINSCLRKGSIKSKHKCGLSNHLLPALDVLIEHLSGPSISIRSIVLVVEKAVYPEGDAGDTIGLPTISIPRSADYVLNLPLKRIFKRDYTHNSDEPLLSVKQNINPPLNIAPNTPGRFTLHIKYDNPESPTTLLLHLDIVDSKGVPSSSPRFALYLP